jgi:hypothetical protein
MRIRVAELFRIRPQRTCFHVSSVTWFSRIPFCSIIGKFLLTLLLLTVAMQAQSASAVVSDFQQINYSTEQIAGSDQATDVGFSFTPPSESSAQSSDPQQQSSPAPEEKSDKAARRAARIARDLADPNRNIYYKNKFELGVDVGYLPINIPFAFDVFLGDGYNKTPLNYTLVPIITSVRWHIDNIEGRSVFRGNWDAQCSLGVVPIPRGPETHYVSWILGIRRNFIPRKIKIAPYFDFRAGMGDINAKGPLGVEFAQGQDFTFTLNVGSGVRYNFSQKYTVSAGLHYMHISNLYLSQPKFPNYGINVYGPMVGIDVRLGKPHHGATE